MAVEVQHHLHSIADERFIIYDQDTLFRNSWHKFDLVRNRGIVSPALAVA
jgi:hypothetical protein